MIDKGSANHKLNITTKPAQNGSTVICKLFFNFTDENFHLIKKYKQKKITNFWWEVHIFHMGKKTKKPPKNQLPAHSTAAIAHCLSLVV